MYLQKVKEKLKRKVGREGAEAPAHSSPVKCAAPRLNRKKGLTGQADLSIFNPSKILMIYGAGGVNVADSKR
jgi:hypothetical protein